jgi:hypothetical protein
MKSKRRLVFFLLALLAVVSASVYAHPGRTDGSGGHTNHSSGEYHYHHGYSEHQHYDMDKDGIVDCPYEFNDNTIHKDSNSTSSPDSFSDEYYRIIQEERDKGELGYWERKLIELEEEQQRNREAAEKQKTYEAVEADDITTDKSDDDEGHKDISKITFKDVLQALFTVPLFSWLTIWALAFIFWIVELAAKMLIKKKINYTDRFIRGLLVVSVIIGFGISIYLFP